MPFLSVLLPVYGDSPHLLRAIESTILAASASCDSEILIIFDRPSEMSRELATTFAGERGVRILNSPKPGLPAALNFGIVNSDSELIARMDSDDICHPQRFLLQTQRFTENLNLVGLGTQGVFIGDFGEYLGFSSLPVHHKEIAKIIPILNPFIHPSMVYRRSAIERVGYYDETLFVAQDHELHGRLVQAGDIENLEKFLIGYRRWSGQQGEYSDPNGKKELKRLEVSRMVREKLMYKKLSQRRKDATDLVFRTVSQGTSLPNLLRLMSLDAHLTLELASIFIPLKVRKLAKGKKAKKSFAELNN